MGSGSVLITSLENNKIKELVKLQNKKYRDEKNLFLIETLNIINEAYELGILKEIYKTEDLDIDLNIPTYDVTLNVMNKIKQIKTSKIVGVAYKMDNTKIKGNKILLLDGIQDPGNLGTIIRSALGFNIDTIILSNNCVDLYNDKVIRATEGALFKINIIRKDLKDAINTLNKNNIPIYKTDVNNGIDVCKIKKDKYAVIIGSEGKGISKEINDIIKQSIYIKTNKELESLNVGVATSIILYELDKK